MAGNQTGQGPRLDVSVASIARIYDYWLGGKDNFQIDRDAGDLMIKQYPDIVTGVRLNRAFLGRAVRYLATEAGVRQFLDIGTGLPSSNNTHEVAQRAAPESRIVYVDNDPVVLSHARALLTSTPEGACAYIDADIRDTGQILAEAETLLDFSRPIAICLIMILQFVPDDDNPWQIVNTLLDGCPPGSYLTVAHPANDVDQEVGPALRQLSSSMGKTRAAPRSHAQISRFFDGLEMIEPGLVQLHRWRPGPDSPPADWNLAAYGGMGRKLRLSPGLFPDANRPQYDRIMSGPELPVIDVSPLTGVGIRPAAAAEVAARIQAACREHGFFYVSGHGLPAGLLDELAEASAEFFARPEADKLEIAMARGGRAWRGFFPVGAELTSGRPDLKEGLYFGAELPADDPRVLAGIPLHGANLFPRQVPRLRPLVLAYLDAMTSVGQAVLAGVALSLGLDAGYFATGYTADPTILFRIFHYPPSPPRAADWGVGEHTDYGLVTLLAQDDSGGLEIAAPGGWIQAPPVPGTLVCNIGDMLDRLTGGWYRSTPHRVRNLSGHGRLSFPFFLDPGFGAEVPPLPSSAAAAPGEGPPRWDGQDLRAFTGTYGDYLIGKVSKVFPQLMG